MATYNPEDSINKAFDYIQKKRASGHKFGSTPVYNITKDDLRALMRVGNKYGIPFEWLINLIRHETATTFNPAVTNYIGATGLIQFLPSTAKGYGTTVEDLRKMNFQEQLKYVDMYIGKNLKRFLTADGKVPSEFTQGDIFMTIFYPAAVLKPNYQFPDSVPKYNPGVYKPKDYADKSLRSAVFPTSEYPYTLKDFISKFGEFWKGYITRGIKAAKTNPITTALITIGIIVTSFIIYKKYKK